MVPHVTARMGQEVAAIDRGEDAEQNRNLNGAGGVIPAVSVMVELESRFGVVERNRKRFGARFLFDRFDLLAQRRFPRRARLPLYFRHGET